MTKNNKTRRFARAGLVGLALILMSSSLALASTALEERVLALEESNDNFGFDGRPFLQSDDGNFRIEFGLRLQARYTFQMKDKRGNSTLSDRDQSWGEIERGRLNFQGHVFNPQFQYKIEADGHSDEGDLGFTDAYIKYDCAAPSLIDNGHNFAVGVGQWKPFFGRQEKTSSGKQLMVDRSLANEFFNIDRNLGAWAEGRHVCGGDGIADGFSYELGISNGIDSVNKSFGDNETDQMPAFIFHFDVDWMGNLGKDALSSGDLKRRDTPGLTTGASFMTDHNNGTASIDNQKFGVYQTGLDTVYKFAGFNANAEYFARWLDLEDPGAANVPRDSVFTHGGYIEGGYMCTDQLQFVTRGSVVWDGEASSHTAVEAGAGFNYFFWKHNLKLSTDVVFVDIPDNMSPKTESLAGLQEGNMVGGPIQSLDNFTFDSSSANLEAMQGIIIRTQLQLTF